MNAGCGTSSTDMGDSSLWPLGKAFGDQPVEVILEPVIGTRALFLGAESMSALGVDMQFRGFARRPPSIEDRSGGVGQQWIIGGNQDKCGRRIARNCALGHCSVDDSEEIRA